MDKPKIDRIEISNMGYGIDITAYDTDGEDVFSAYSGEFIEQISGESHKAMLQDCIIALDFFLTQEEQRLKDNGIEDVSSKQMWIKEIFNKEESEKEWEEFKKRSSILSKL